MFCTFLTIIIIFLLFLLVDLSVRNKRQRDVIVKWCQIVAAAEEWDIASTAFNEALSKIEPSEDVGLEGTPISDRVKRAYRALHESLTEDTE